MYEGRKDNKERKAVAGNLSMELRELDKMEPAFQDTEGQYKGVTNSGGFYTILCC